MPNPVQGNTGTNRLNQSTTSERKSAVVPVSNFSRPVEGGQTNSSAPGLTGSNIPDIKPTVREIFRKGVMENQDQGGRLLGTIGGVFEGASQVISMPFRDRKTPSLLSIPFAIISGMVSVVGKLFTGTGTAVKEMSGWISNKTKPIDYETAQKNYTTLSRKLEVIDTNINNLQESITAKNNEIKECSEVAKNAESSIKPGDVESLNKIKDYRKLIGERDELNKKLKDFLWEKEQTAKRLEKAKKRLDRAKQNIPQEARALMNNSRSIV